MAASFLLFCEAAQSFAALDLGDQNTDLSRFPQLKLLFQLGVPVNTFVDLSKEQATAEAAEQRPRTGDRSWLLRDFLPKPWRIERPHIAGVPPPRPGGARGATACLDQSKRRPGWGSSEASCRPKVLLEAQAASSEEVAAQVPDRWPLRPNARAVVCLGRCPQREVRVEECRTRRSCTVDSAATWLCHSAHRPGD